MSAHGRADKSNYLLSQADTICLWLPITHLGQRWGVTCGPLASTAVHPGLLRAQQHSSLPGELNLRQPAGFEFLRRQEPPLLLINRLRHSRQGPPHGPTPAVACGTSLPGRLPAARTSSGTPEGLAEEVGQRVEDGLAQVPALVNWAGRRVRIARRPRGGERRSKIVTRAVDNGRIALMAVRPVRAHLHQEQGVVEGKLHDVPARHVQRAQHLGGAPLRRARFTASSLTRTGISSFLWGRFPPWLRADTGRPPKPTHPHP